MSGMRTARGARTTIVPATRSPIRSRSRLKNGTSASAKTHTDPTSRAHDGASGHSCSGTMSTPSGTNTSISRMRLRATTMSVVSGPPWRSMTRILSARLPGVCPRQRISKTMK